MYTKSVDHGAPAATATSTKLTTVLKDHLGSTSVLVVGTWNGSVFATPVVEHQAFDPWGERRGADSGAALRTVSTDPQYRSAQAHTRGYTGHEQLDDSGLIHMNGRIYDPEIARFLSPDPVVQVPEFSQNFNRYSYVLNNPLNATDPSGFSGIGSLFHKVGSWLKQNWRTIVSIVVAVCLFCVLGRVPSASREWVSPEPNSGHPLVRPPGRSMRPSMAAAGGTS